MTYALLFIAGLTVGLLVGLAFAWWRVRDIRSVTSQMMADKNAETEKLIAQMKESFDSLSLQALSKNTEEFLKVAEERLSKQTGKNEQQLDGKKQLIDQTLKSMKGELDKVNQLVQTIEKDRQAKFDVLSKEIIRTADETKQLRETTHGLKAALSNSRVRGQWGERMAEDVLRLAGLTEGINYRKQLTLEDGESNRSRPDYTFYLPQNRMVHMDVKFPLENYLQYLDATDDTTRQKFRDQFLKDARARVKEVTKRGYTDADTLDYTLVFIPNEQVYAFVNEHDRNLLDEAMQSKVILCSPTTLYAILAVIRQAVENFHLERTAGQILDVLTSFQGQWDKFCEAMDTLGKRMESSQKAFEELTGPRKRMLEKPLQQIDELSKKENLPDGSKSHLRLVDAIDQAENS